MQPNVVVILLDTARADAFEPYGAPVGASPVLADLASGGAAAPLAHAPSNWTVPSHASMFTGRLPLELGFGQSPTAWGKQCRSLLEASVDRSLPQVLGAAGYSTFGVSANAWIGPRTGFAAGFEEFHRAHGRRYEGIQEPGLRARLTWAQQALRAEIDDGAGEAARLLGDWLDRRERDDDRRPFFAFVNLVECHSPFLPPKPWTTLSPWQRLRAGEESRRHLTLEEIFRVNAGPFDVPAGAVERMRTGYRDAIRMMDDWIGRVVEDLDRRSVLQDTVLLVTSDHGENFGENGELCHTMSLSDRLIRVPFVVHGPGAAVPEGPWGLERVPHLIADLVGLEQDPWQWDPAPMDAAVAQYDGPSRHDPSKAESFAEKHGLDEEAVRRMTCRESCATDGRRKLVRRDDGTELLYDLVADPTEAAPVPVAVGADVPGHLRDALDRADRAAATPVAVPSADGGELDELEGQLKLLGYL